MPYTLANFPSAPRFAGLAERFYSRVTATPLPDVRLAAWNPQLASELGLHADAAAHPDLAEYLAGNKIPHAATPLASVYAGHQFGQFVPQLGDGRALLIGELSAPDQQIYELQLKGAGLTPYSRMGDGRAVLRSTIREYLCSEAMHGLGIPTTRALGMVASPQPVWRETIESAAVVLRVAPSFVRFGHFEYYARHGHIDALRTLADWTITHFYPQCRNQAEPYAALLAEVSLRTINMIVRWQGAGFCHGVMNSDNMSILGLTLDYGPFGFLDGFNAGHICNHSDHHGRYAWNQQPEIALWNLYCLGQALSPIADHEALNAVLEQYQGQFEAAFADHLRQKLGLDQWQDHDWELISDLLELMQHAGTDWTCFWRQLAQFDQAGQAALHDHFIDRAAFDAWSQRYRQRLALNTTSTAERQASMNAINPVYVLRNHLAEIAIRQAQQGDFSEIPRLQACLAQPYSEKSEYADYAKPAPDWAAELSVSCSS